jgi:signal transduction histidine kinase
VKGSQERLLDISLGMLRPAWGWPERYGIAVVATVLVAALKLSVPAFGAQGPDLFLTIPVAASAVFGGFGPALLATIGATILAAYFTPPAGLIIQWNASGLDVLGFFFEGVIVAVLGAGVRAAFGRTLESLRRGEELERERSALIETVNHELRNPLASLSGHVQLASRYAARDDRRDRVPAALEQAQQQIARLIRLTDDLLVLSRSIDTFRVESTTFDLAKAAQAAARRAEVLDPSRRIGVSPSSLRLYVRGDPSRLDQILDNLLKNAINYSSRGSAIEISVREDRDLGRGIVRVRDHGHGVAAADRVRIFERFVRGSTGQDVTGSGLGLFVSSELASRMGGRLFLEETSSSGSVFSIELPIAVRVLDRDGDGDGAVGRGDPPGVEDRGEQLDAVEQAGTGPAEVGRAGHPDHAGAAAD